MWLVWLPSHGSGVNPSVAPAVDMGMGYGMMVLLLFVQVQLAG